MTVSLRNGTSECLTTPSLATQTHSWCFDASHPQLSRVSRPMTPAPAEVRYGTWIPSFVHWPKVDDEIPKHMSSCAREMVRTAEVGRRIRLLRRTPSRRLVSARPWISTSISDLFIRSKHLCNKFQIARPRLTTCLSHATSPCQKPSETCGSPQPPTMPSSSSSWPQRTRKRTRRGVPMS